MGMLLSKLHHLFSQSIHANAARLLGLSFLVSAILRCRTVNLVILSTCDDGRDVSNESRYRRLQDWFLHANLCYRSIGKFIVSRIPKPPKGYTLAMDRTNWKFGRKDINFLVISIVAGTVSVPLVWKVLPMKTKRGNSNTSQRTALTNRLLQILPASDIYVLTMDREFVGQRWLKYLKNKKIAFIVRIKMNSLINGERADQFAAKLLTRHLQDGGQCKVYGMDLFFACKRMSEDARAEYLLVISNHFRGKQALKLYRKRWGIERLFWHLKKKGFDLEATHMSSKKKLDKLFAVLALAFLVSFAWGCRIRHCKQQTSKQSMRKSLFRLGLEDILRLAQPMYYASKLRKKKREDEVNIFIKWLASERFGEIFLV